MAFAPALGLWRLPHLDPCMYGQLRMPEPRVIEGKDSFFHGNYVSQPYLLITSSAGPVTPTAVLEVYTDDPAFKGLLRPVADKPGSYALEVGGASIGTLALCGRPKKGEPEKLILSAYCFTLALNPPPPAPAPAATATTAPAADSLPASRKPDTSSPYTLTAGTYAPVYKKLEYPETDYSTLGNLFTSLPANFEAAKSCYNIRSMDPDDFQTTGCQQPLFALPPTARRYYERMTVHGGHTAAIPYGWIYGNRIGARGEERTTIIETGSEVNDAFSWDIGVSADFTSPFFNAGFHFNQKTKSRVEDMYNRNLTYAKSDFLKTGYVLVLDKLNVSLDSRLMEAFDKLAITRDYTGFLDRFGTHYPYATVYGARGRFTNTMTRDEVVSMKENGIDMSVGAKAGFSAFGFGGSIGVDYANSSDHLNRMRKVQGDNAAKFACVGGDECHNGQPSGTSMVPVLLDLRPISELLGPPFQTSTKYLELRAGLQDAIAQYAMYEGSTRSGPHTAYLRVGPAVGGDKLALNCGLDSLAPGTRAVLDPPLPPGRPRPRMALMMNDSASACCAQSVEVLDLKISPAPPSSASAAGNGEKPTPGIVAIDLKKGVLVSAKDDKTPLLATATMAFNPIDFNKYCRSIGRRGAKNTDGTGTGWRCIAGSTDEEIDMKKACDSQYGPIGRPRLTSKAPGGPNDWTCAQDGVDISQYCRARNFESSFVGRDQAWFCGTSNPMPGPLAMPARVEQVSMEKLCQEQFGPLFFPVKGDPNDSDSWYCDAGLSAIRTLTALPGAFSQKPNTPFGRVSQNAASYAQLIGAGGQYQPPNPAEPGATVQASIPLQWDETMEACKYTSVDLMMSLTPLPARQVLATDPKKK